MSLFAKSVFCYDMPLETDLTENYTTPIKILQEAVIDSIKNLFQKA